MAVAKLAETKPEPCALEQVAACDLCGGKSFRTRKEWKDILLFGPETWRLVECEGCKLSFISPRPTRSAIGGFYPNDYPAHFAAATQPKPWHRAQSSQSDEQLGLLWRTYIHVGCGSGGRYLDVLKGLGWSTHGVEPSAEAVAGAVAKGHTAVVGSAEEQHFDDASMDVVTMWHVLEHTHSPTQALESCFKTLRPGGQLSLCVPNWGSMQAAVFGRYWWSCDAPRHLFQFTKKTLRPYLERAGFRILHVTTRTGATSWQRAFRHMANGVLGTKWARDSSVLVSMGDPLVAFLSAFRFFGVGAELRVIAERPA
jgi:predicted SAM-dependent methyltransferase